MEIFYGVDTFDGSGFTGSSVYDFDGDGASEVVYETDDVKNIGWEKLVVRYEELCTCTRWEYPVVADVNGDGTTNIVCACNDTGVTALVHSQPWVPVSIRNQQLICYQYK